MLTEVNSKPIRGIISDVQFSMMDGRVTAILDSPDLCQGEEGRNELVQGRSIRTSNVQAIDVVEGQLIVITENSAYIVDGEVGIWEETLKTRSTEWVDADGPRFTRSMTGLSS